MAFPYACAECGAQVSVSWEGQISRPCDHDGAAVIAERTSVLYGEGGAGEPSLYQRAVSAMHKLAKVLG